MTIRQLITQSMLNKLKLLLIELLTCVMLSAIAIIPAMLIALLHY